MKAVLQVRDQVVLLWRTSSFRTAPLPLVRVPDRAEPGLDWVAARERLMMSASAAGNCVVWLRGTGPQAERHYTGRPGTRADSDRALTVQAGVILTWQVLRPGVPSRGRR